MTKGSSRYRGSFCGADLEQQQQQWLDEPLQQKEGGAIRTEGESGFSYGRSEEDEFEEGDSRTAPSY